MANFTRESIPFNEAVDFTRASGDASYYDADRVLQFAAVDEPRFDHGPATGEALGLLIEESRTNLLLWSEAFDNAVWTKTGVTVSTNAIAAPDGEMTADKLVESANNEVHNVTQLYTLTLGENYVQGYFVKPDEVTTAVLRRSAARTDVLLVEYDLSAKTASDPAGSVVELADGWLLLLIQFTCTLAGSGGYGLYLRQEDAYQGDGTSGLYVWGAQAEQGSSPTSYIKTEASQVTRAADNCSRTLGAEFNASEGAFTVVAKAAIGTTIIQAGDLSIVSDSDDEKTYTLSYSEDPSATTLDLLPSGIGTIKSINYEPGA